MPSTSEFGVRVPFQVGDPEQLEPPALCQPEGGPETSIESGGSRLGRPKVVPPQIRRSSSVCSGPLMWSPDANWMLTQLLGRDARGCWQLAAAHAGVGLLPYSGGSCVSNVV